MREIRVHGQDRRYHHSRVGINGRMDALQAAVLLAKIEVFADEIEARERVARRYSKLIADAFQTNDGQWQVTTPFIEAYNSSVFAQYTIETAHREAVVAGMEARGVPTAVHYPVPLHQQPAFCSPGECRWSFPISETAAGCVMSLPMHPYLREQEQSDVISALREAVEAMID
jgi:UDP-2-acetamido-2-deoxy-ribo-hexuluronate aminotransferase